MGNVLREFSKLEIKIMDSRNMEGERNKEGGCDYDFDFGDGERKSIRIP